MVLYSNVCFFPPYIGYLLESDLVECNVHIRLVILFYLFYFFKFYTSCVMIKGKNGIMFMALATFWCISLYCNSVFKNKPFYNVPFSVIKMFSIVITLL